MKTGTLDPVSNSATWRGNIELLDDTTDLAFDLADVEAMTLKLRDTDSGAIVLTGSLGTELLAVGDDADGVVQFTFSASVMSGIAPKTYEVGVLVTDDDDFVTEIILGRVSVLEGL